MTVLDKINNGEITITSDEDAIRLISIHLLTQMDQSFGGLGDCAYRGRTEGVWDEDGYEIIEPGNPTGLACAIGCIIPESLYTPEIEGLTIEDYTIFNLVKEAHPNWETTDLTLKLLKSFQIIHDRVHPFMWALYIDALTSIYKHRKNELIRIDGIDALSIVKENVLASLEHAIMLSRNIDQHIESIRNKILEDCNIDQSFL